MKIITLLLLAWTLYGALHAQEQNEQFKKIKPYKGIKLKVPESFKQMKKHDMKFRVPSYKKPTAMYTDKNEVVDFGINFSVTPWGDDYELLKEFYKATLESLFKHLTFIQDGNIKTINERKYLVYEILTDHKERRGMNQSSYVSKYTYLLYTVIDNKVLVFNFSAPFRYKDQWQPIAHKMMESIEIKDDIKAPAYKPVGED